MIALPIGGLASSPNVILLGIIGTCEHLLIFGTKNTCEHLMIFPFYFFKDLTKGVDIFHFSIYNPINIAKFAATLF